MSKFYDEYTGYQGMLNSNMEVHLYRNRDLGEMPMDIYTICGFSDYSNFYRAFKKYYHMSPNEFLRYISE